MRTSSIRTLGLVLVATGLAACSVLEGQKIDYKSARQVSGLEVPPDLTRLNSDSRYQVPASGVATASDLYAQSNTGAAQTPNTTAIQSAKGVRLESDGGLRWMVTDVPPERLWDQLQGFWANNGFVVNVSEPKLGIIETDWAENRAKLPQDFVRATLGKLIESLYSTGELDKFRTRVERNKQGETEIFISHRGMIEVYNSNDNTSTTWQPRPSDPALESEFLKRMMIALGQSEGAASQAVERSAANLSYATATDGGLLLRDTVERAWRRVGLALDRTGFTVVKRDGEAQTYQVRYVQAEAVEAEEPGFFGKLFSSSKAPQEPVAMTMSLAARGEGQALLSIQSANTEAAEAALQLLRQDLR